MRALYAIFVCVLAGAAAAGGAQPAVDALRMERVYSIHLRITEKQWQMMQPTRASRLATVLEAGQRPATRPVAAAGEAEPASYVEGEHLKPSGHGYEYAYVRAGVEIDGEKFADVGLRFRGNGSYGLTASSLKRPLHLDFARFAAEQRYHGLKTLYLRNNAVDPSEICESLSMALCREMGVPAPLTSLAVVYLTIDGRYDREFLGIYTVVEEIDRSFLERQFGTHRGLLVKPETTRSWPYLGGNWDDYARYGIKNEGPALARGNFMELTRLINRADDAAFCEGLGSLLDLDEFLRFMAINVAMVNTDSFIGGGHNFYVHVHPKTGRISFIPWDMNYSFGSSGRSMADWTSLGIRRPYRADNHFAERVFADESMRHAYYDHLRKLCQGPFSPARMHERIDRMEQVVRRAMEISAAAGRPRPTTLPTSAMWDRPNLKEFVTARVKVIQEQLAAEASVESRIAAATRPAPSTRPAVAPAMPAIAPVRTPVAIRGGLSRSRPAGPQLLAAIDANRDGSLSRDEVVESVHLFFIAHARFSPGTANADSIARTLDRLVSLVDPMPASLAEAPATRPTPASLVCAQRLAALADANGDGRITLDELTTAVDRLFRQADANGDGILTSRELGLFVDRFVSRP